MWMLIRPSASDGHDRAGAVQTGAAPDYSEIVEHLSCSAVEGYNELRRF